MTRFIFIRHGETDYNSKGLIQGITDNPLNDNGLNQAILVADELRKFEIEVFVSSPLIRAKKTLEIIKSKLGYEESPIIIDERFTERSFGDLEGKEIFLGLNAIKNKDFKKYDMEDNESLISRIKEGIFDLSQKFKEKTIIVCCHSQVIKAILLELDNTLNYDIKLKNTEYIILGVENNIINKIDIN